MTAPATIETVVDWLNEAFVQDPAAFSALMHNIQPCNETMGDGEAIECQRFHGSAATNALGMLNGLIRRLGLGRVVPIFEQGKDGVYVINGYIADEVPT